MNITFIPEIIQFDPNQIANRLLSGDEVQTELPIGKIKVRVHGKFITQIERNHEAPFDDCKWYTMDCLGEYFDGSLPEVISKIVNSINKNVGEKSENES